MGIRRVFNVLFRDRVVTEILEKRSVLIKYQTELDALLESNREVKDSCCLTCMFGSNYSKAESQAFRAAYDLRVLLEQNADPFHIEEIRQLKRDYPKPPEARVTCRNLR